MTNATGAILTEQEHWDDVWDSVTQPYDFVPDVVWVHRVWDSLFKLLLPKAPASCLEIGCGASPYLAWIGSELGLAPYGLDYSRKGIELCHMALQKRSVSGTIVQADFFSDETGLPKQCFDAVVSFGFIEHFEDTSMVLRRMAEYLKPGGTLLCTVPNLAGLNGLIMRWFDKELFDKHVVLTPDNLKLEYKKAGVSQIMYADYFGSICLQSTSWKKLLMLLGKQGAMHFMGMLDKLDHLVWNEFYRKNKGSESWFFSPHVMICGRIPASETTA